MAKDKSMTTEDKELQIESLKQNRINSAREIELIGAAKANQTKRLELFEKFMAVRKVMHDIAVNNYSYVNPTYAFQALPEYAEAQKQYAQIEFDLDTFKRENELEQAKSIVKSFDDQIESQHKSIVDIDAKIEELSK
jgi:hypothetical protein